ncbi:MAG TPA: prolyl oligopeptidase family serine peptidase, partial [Chloroflexota bacterium]
EAMKLAAHLQAATSSGQPILMRVEAQGGHGVGSTRRQQDEDLADELAFLLDRFGLSRSAQATVGASRK